MTAELTRYELEDLAEKIEILELEQLEIEKAEQKEREAQARRDAITRR